MHTSDNNGNLIEAHQVQHRGVQVMHVHAVFDRPEAELIGNAAAGQPDREAVVIVIATTVSLANWRAAEFAPPRSRVFHSAAHDL